MWAEPSTGGQGALGLPQELLSWSQAEQPTAPCHEKTLRACHLLESVRQLLHVYHQDGGGKHLFLSQLGNMSVNKEPCTLI